MARTAFSTLLGTCLLLLLAGQAQAADRRTPVVDAVAKAGPAVVNIRTEQIVKRRASSWFGFGESIFENFFRDFDAPRYYKTQSLGSGVVIDRQGHVLTNAHVIEKASRIFVALPGREKEVEASLVGMDELIDLAVLCLAEDGTLPFLPLGSSSDLLLGETVIAIGNPLGLGHSITTGIVSSAARRLLVDEGVVSVFIQTDALINPGNSGGPLININGELIGINTAIARQAQGIGFSIPIDVARRVLDDLIEFGRVRRAFLGVFPGLVGRRFASSRGSGGVLVTEVEPGSPAEAAGLRVADVILGLDGVSVEAPDQYLSVLGTYTPGDEVTLRLLRGTEPLQVTVALTAVPPGFVLNYAQRVFGFGLEQGSNGVTVSVVEQGSPAEKIGLRRGDLLTQVEGGEVADVDSFISLLGKHLGRFPVKFLFVRGNRGYYVDLP